MTRPLGYAATKAAAKRAGVNVPDLLVMAQKNDPFYVGSKTDRQKASWFLDVWGRTGYERAHLRRIHYWCVSQGALLRDDGEPYENTDGCWQRLVDCSLKARHLGLVDVGRVVDHKNPDPRIAASYSNAAVRGRASLDVPDEQEAIDLHVDGFRSQDLQPYHLEVWIEKSTMNDVLVPACQRHGANLVTGEGEMSLHAVHRLVQRLREAARPARIFYVSDFDPAGQSMPRAVSRKLEHRLAVLQVADADVKLTPLALTAEQVSRYSLPRTPIKESERRAAKFEATHGTGAVELDALEALHPGTLGQVVGGALGHYHRFDAGGVARGANRRLADAVQEQVDEVVARYEEPLRAFREARAALEDLRAELAGVNVDGEPFRPARLSADADDGAFPWLFDSSRAWEEQLRVYRAYGAGELGGAA